MLEFDKSNINKIDTKLGWSPLYKAVFYGDIQIIQILLDNGADP